ncbi:MAG: sulfatase-like hydrolase/transferase, partial [Planctomycetota bacterium]
MFKRNRLLLLGFILIATACGKPPDLRANREAIKAGSAGLNVLVITLDTTRADRIGCYGYTRGKTPNIDALADAGVLFENAFTPVPLTAASHASIFTGNFPPYHGVRTNDEMLLDEPNESLAERLKARGYSTAAFIGAQVLHRNSGMNQGFDLYEDDFSGKAGAGGEFIPEKPAEAVVQPAMAWLKKNKDKDKPFFLWVHLFDPHHPYNMPAPFRDDFRSSPYDGEIAYSDFWIGKLLETLDEIGEREDTLVAFLSDHGEGLGEHQEKSHGIFIYDTTLHVPLILSNRKILPAGARVAAQARTIDLVPTVLDLAGAPAPGAVQGQSLLPLIDGVASPPRALYAESFYANTAFGWSPLLGLRVGDWKMIQAPRPELYHVGEDAGEMKDLFKNRAEEAGRMIKTLEEWAPTLAREGVSASRALDSSAREMLNALGYLTGSRRASSSQGAGQRVDPKDRTRIMTAIQGATELSYRRRFKEAAQILEGLLKEEPECLKILQLLGETLIKTKDYQRAFEIYQKLIKLDREEDGAYVNLGMICLFNKQYEDGQYY